MKGERRKGKGVDSSSVFCSTWLMVLSADLSLGSILPLLVYSNAE